jgi:hypothetical protein
VKISEGIGVSLLTWNSVKKAGIWPSWAPVAKRRAEVNRTPLTPPKVDNATNTGITHLQPPNKRSPKTCKVVGDRFSLILRISNKFGSVTALKQ